MKKFLLLSFATCVAFGTFAQTPRQGSFKFLPVENQAALDPTLQDATSVAGTTKIVVTPWFDSDLSMPTLDPATKTCTDGSFYIADRNADGAPTKIGEYIATKAKCEKNKASLHGVYVAPDYKDGVIYATVPETFLDYGTVEDVAKPGSIVFHMVMGGSPRRINDQKTGGDNEWGAYLYNMTGANMLIEAPEYAKVNLYFSTPGLVYPEGYQINAGTLFLDFPNAKGNMALLKSGAPYNNLAIITSNPLGTGEWWSGYCCKFVDVAISNLKVGDKVGFGGLETLYDGYTPTLTDPAGVNDILFDNTDAPEVYYNLQGVKVANPEKGMYIKVQGNKSTKVVL